jgi:hypothetical protein
VEIDHLERGSDEGPERRIVVDQQEPQANPPFAENSAPWPYRRKAGTALGRVE